MKSPNFSKWVEKKRKESTLHSRRGEYLEAVESLTPVLKEYGKRYERLGLRKYKTMKSTRVDFSHEIERDMRNARRAYEQAGQAYEKLGDIHMAERMYRRAGMNEKADYLGNELATRKESRWTDLGISMIVFILGVNILFFAFSFTGFVVADNYFIPKFSFWGILAGLLALTIFAFLKKKLFYNTRQIKKIISV